MARFAHLARICGKTFSLSHPFFPSVGKFFARIVFNNFEIVMRIVKGASSFKRIKYGCHKKTTLWDFVDRIALSVLCRESLSTKTLGNHFERFVFCLNSILFWNCCGVCVCLWNYLKPKSVLLASAIDKAGVPDRRQEF